MSGLDDILQTVDLLYAAALDRQLWPTALDRLAGQTGGIGTAVLSVSQMDAQALSSQSLHETAADYVRNEWWKRDILREEGIRRGSPTGLLTDHDVISEDVRRRHPFVQEFWRKHGVCGMASYSSALSPGHVTVFSIQRSVRQGEFEANDLRVLATLGPHAARALRIANRIADADARATSLEAMLDRFTVAAVLIDRVGHVGAINARAHALMGRGYTLARGAFRATTCAGQRAMDALMKSVFDHSGETAPRHALLPLTDGSPGLVAQAFRLPRNRESPFRETSPDQAILILTETARTPAGPVEALRAIGLTPAEVRVASLVGAGLSPAEAAEALNIKVSTVRIEMKSIFAKLGVRRQSELAHLVSRLTIVR